MNNVNLGLEADRNTVLDIKNKVPLIKQNTRIFRPSEYKLVVGAIPKQDHRTMVNALLLTGMRYVEMQRFQQYPEWFDGEFIHLPDYAQKKHKRKQKSRVIILNSLGKQIIPYFLQLDKKLPCSETWKTNLRRWTINAGLPPDNVGVKTTRKTWESWLLSKYPTRVMEITISQGHTSITSIQHYMGVGFNDIDKLQMGEYIGGWI